MPGSDESPRPRTIGVVTTSRADYSHLHWILHDLQTEPATEPWVIALGAQLADEFGRTEREIERAGLPVHHRVECLLSSDTDVGMAKTIGVATLGLADLLGRLRPDLLMLVADRYEMLAPAAVALALRIPIAHIEGGEVSEGAVDDAVRNALTKMSHVHFTPTARARRRVLAMGEEAWRVHCVGAPSLDHLRRSELPSRTELAAEIGVDVAAFPVVVVSYHPVTMARDTLREADALFGALELIDAPIVFCFPNADAGSRELVRRARIFCEARSHATLCINLRPTMFWALLQNASAMLGNSSSGIMETPALGLPCVNVGIRQQGRERARNIIDVEPEVERIRSGLGRAVDPDFRKSLAGMESPYGDGRAAARILKVVRDVPLGEELLLKRAVPLPAESDAS